MAYLISNRNKKSVIETQTWTNGEDVIESVTVWRWGSWVSEEPIHEKYLTENENQTCDPYSLSDNMELNDLEDGSTDWTYPVTWTEDQVAMFEERISEGEWEGDVLEELGYTQDDSEFVILGPLEVSEIE